MSLSPRRQRITKLAVLVVLAGLLLGSLAVLAHDSPGLTAGLLDDLLLRSLR